ncbi:MAG: hypothetical protein LIQ30_11410 [Planctomycetes bacterium]|nr:hypothetical protein [Planctomycetota bacterium]MCC8116510.1 hypothetical protein [Planctomycetota bacterium]MCD7895922.1 hypothetical protein [Planctomycetaceae bacterium]
MRIVEIILGLGMILCAIFLGISTYKTHFRKKPVDDAAPVPAESSVAAHAASDITTTGTADSPDKTV